MKNRVLILGSTGMLGSALLNEFKNQNDIDLTFTSRESNHGEKFIVGESSLVELVDHFRPHWIINCVGLINSYIDEKDKESVQLARVINENFPQELLNATRLHDSKIIQIATDCVFSGRKGNYSELDVLDPVDTYGLTKSRGEITSDRFMNIRCSIVGRNERSRKSLLEWFLSNEVGSKVTGYADHFWNGITTDAFARICRGIIRDGLFKHGTYHHVPENSVSKYELLRMFQSRYARFDLEIVPEITNQNVDRTLSTIYESDNEQRWISAGYQGVPSIGFLINDL